MESTQDNQAASPADIARAQALVATAAKTDKALEITSMVGRGLLGLLMGACLTLGTVKLYRDVRNGSQSNTPAQ